MAKSHVSGGVVGANEGIASLTRQAIIRAIPILVGVARDAGIDRPSAARRHHARQFPVIEELSQHFVSAMKWPRLGHPGEREAVPLVGDARSALRLGGKGILYR